MLELAAIDRLYRNRFWATRGQWHDLGGVVARGEGTPVVDDGYIEQTGDDLVLFNAEQVKARRGAPVASLDRFWVAPPDPDYDRARRFLDGTVARVVDADRCFCALCPVPDLDFIGMPPVERTRGEDWWWSALFHELTHYAAEGFDRVRFRGSENHCELVAEIGASLLADRCGIPKRRGMPADTGMVGEWVAEIRSSIGYLTMAWAVAIVAVEWIEACGSGRSPGRGPWGVGWSGA